ncbi:hypothetical protein Hypma_006598 [Hypsizygus marmoreus]|uniref:Uncharacterized protein n=1 Tax=Hypsizygus marmoreus TaxID=39966 RepID=A0A369K1V4_HYPMA|nr:hypothetical protein Hypma_006598 [Hypsizygus marmoreus]
MDSLADAYLSWRNGIHSASSDTEYAFTINVIDIYGLARSAVIPRSADSISAAVSLVTAGFMGSSPYSPSLAISLKTLELF